MHKLSLAIAIATAALLSTQPVLAHEHSMFDDSKSCHAVAQACKKAGYEKKGKGFWFDCMKPIIMGKSVDNVKVDADTAKHCRADKIDRMKKELDELQQAS